MKEVDNGNMKSIGSVYLNFGIATIPLGVYSSVREHKVSFKSICPCGGVIKQKRFCEVEGKEVAYADIQKEYEGIRFGKEEVSKSTENKMEILIVSQKENFNCVIPKQKPYLVNVKKDKKRGSQSKLYQAFIEWLVDNDCYAIVRFSVRTTEHMCLAVPDRETYNLTITPIYYGDEMVKVDDSEFIVQSISDKEKEMSQQFFTNYYNNANDVKSIIMGFEDEQNDKLIKIIEAKAKGQPIVVSKIQPVVEEEDLTKLFEKVGA